MTASTLLIIAQTNVDDGGFARGFAIALIGLMIVFTALLLISLFIASLPRVLALVAQVWPEADDAHLRQIQPDSRTPDDGAILAAIGYVLHTEMQRKIVSEDSSQEKV